MRTNIELDDKLLKEAMRMSKAKTKKEAVNTALREFVEQRKRPDVRELFGKIKFYPGYDYKKARSGRPY